MKTEQVIQFVANDGKRFSQEDKCREYEQDCEAVAPYVAMLPHDRPSYGTYRQLDKDRLCEAKAGIWMAVQKKYGTSWPRFLEVSPAEAHPMRGPAGRILDDIGGPIADAWLSLMRFDFDTGREYDQPYYAIHPGEAVPMLP